MLTRILHRLAEHPWVYDRLQFLAGVRSARSRLGAQITRMKSSRWVLDLGGGTGLYRRLWPSASNYICLDLDMAKLSRHSHLYPGAMGVGADAARLPLRSESVDAVMCLNVSHHLPAAALEELLDESGRVLKPGGRLVFMDAVWEQRRWAGRLLWKYDRGAFPRTAEHLRSLISKRYRLIHDEEYALYHAYLLCVGEKRSPPAPG